MPLLPDYRTPELKIVALYRQVGDPGQLPPIRFGVVFHTGSTRGAGMRSEPSKASDIIRG